MSKHIQYALVDSTSRDYATVVNQTDGETRLTATNLSSLINQIGNWYGVSNVASFISATGEFTMPGYGTKYQIIREEVRVLKLANGDLEEIATHRGAEAPVTPAPVKPANIERWVANSYECNYAIEAAAAGDEEGAVDALVEADDYAQNPDYQERIDAFNTAKAYVEAVFGKTFAQLKKDHFLDGD